MSDAKSYTMEEQVRSAVSLDLMHVAAADRVIATVRALDAAQAEVTALKARVAELKSHNTGMMAEALSVVRERSLAVVAREKAEAEVTALRAQLKAEARRADMAQLDDSKRDELAALRARVAELEASGIAFAKEAMAALETRANERDEWKAKAEALMGRAG